jgi:hypothetical protein
MWFKFNAGSQLVHFRFPKRYRKEAWDGVKSFFEWLGPTTKRAQPLIDNPTLRERLRDKIGKVIKWRYLVTSGVIMKSYIKYFAAPNGDDDVRMVYDAAANKLNESMWVPTVWLPMIDTLVQGVDRGSWMMDRDVGDMFLNYQLHGDVCLFTAVDLACLYECPDEPGSRWAVWDRNLMGFAGLPYSLIKMALVAKEICKGDQFQTGLGLDGKELNSFQWK